MLPRQHRQLPSRSPEVQQHSLALLLSLVTGKPIAWQLVWSATDSRADKSCVNVEKNQSPALARRRPVARESGNGLVHPDHQSSRAGGSVVLVRARACSLNRAHLTASSIIPTKPHLFSFSRDTT